ncbi:MAG: Na/Pi cotransporter family protein [Magnetococcales bacterium]|nr:Na/Pi cotransporter family protein [Magnetococcales bacterium]
MLRHIVLPSMLGVLAYGFWISPDFKGIAAGVAIFLFGMLALEDGFRVFTGGALEKILHRTTDKLWKSLSFGVVTTTIMQSSSLVSVITISFLSAGLLGLSEGIGIIFGANLGTTTGAWLVAAFGLKVKISAYAMPMLVFGIIMVFQKSKTLNGIGYILAGLGFLFLGIHYMKEGFEAFKSTIDLTQFAVTGYKGLFIFTLIGIFATVVMQSSHATLVLIITALAAQQITYENALALAIGANVGTTITAIIGAMSANEQGKRLAGAHLIFNVVTGFIAIMLMPQFVWAVDSISAAVGIGITDYTLKLAVFHTLFNLAGILVMIPFIQAMVNLLFRIIPSHETSTLKPRYLNTANIEFPDTAVRAVQDETVHIFENARDLLGQALGLKPDHFQHPECDLATEIKAQKKLEHIDLDQGYEKNVKSLYSAVIAFISKAPFSWQQEQSGNLHWLRDANQNIVEAIKNVEFMQENMMTYSASDNRHIKREYDALRVHIGRVLQELEVRREDHRASLHDAQLEMAKLRDHWDYEERAFSRHLFDLIRDEKITPEMGTSLMNDSGHTFAAIRNLLAMGTTLFVFGHRSRMQSVATPPRATSPNMGTLVQATTGSL